MPATRQTPSPSAPKRHNLGHRGTRRFTDAPPDARGPRRSQAVFEYTFSRRRIAEPLGTVRSPADVAALLRAYMRPDEAEQERLVVALMNVRNEVIGLELIYIGNASGAAVRVGEVFRAAVRLNAHAIVVCHSHPSGDPTPSGDDLAITRDLAEAGRILDIELVDHVILGSNERTASLRALGHLGAS